MPSAAAELAGAGLAAGDAVPPFGPWTVLTASRPEPAPLLAVALVAALYLFGVRRLRARGDRWPGGRTVSFVVGGLGAVLAATTSGLAAFDTTLFAPHMAQHMLLTMVAPVFLALGAPVTLALRTLKPAPRRRVLSVLHSRAAGLVTFPLLGWVLFVASPFALYSTGWYRATLEQAWLHQLLHLHFLLVGCLLFWPLLGIDPVLGRHGHALRMLLIGLTLPFHAFLGVSIMSVPPDGVSLIAGDWYLRLLPLERAVFQQELGGALLWAAGDLVGLLFLGVLLAQWMRASEREAAREDRRLDRLEAAETAATARRAAAAPSP